MGVLRRPSPIPRGEHTVRVGPPQSPRRRPRRLGHGARRGGAVPDVEGRLGELSYLRQGPAWSSPATHQLGIVDGHSISAAPAYDFDAMASVPAYDIHHATSAGNRSGIGRKKLRRGPRATRRVRDDLP